MIFTKLYKNSNKAGCFTFLNKQMARLSVIIPVYNTLSTLERCIRSVLSQKVTDMEVILVDDGSTDGSSAMCDTLASTHGSVRVIHRENGGLSAARNTGIEASSGTWLSFIDSDDELSPDTLSANLEWLESNPGTDLIEFPANVHYGSPDSYVLSFKPETVEGVNVFRHWIDNDGYDHCYAWNKIYRRELFDNIRFPQGESFEDTAICPKIIGKCQSIRYSDKGCYLYYRNQGGITSRYRFRNQEPLFRHHINLLRQITDDKHHTAARMRLWNRCLNLLTDLYRCQDARKAYLIGKSSALSGLKPGFTDIFRSRLSSRQIIKSISAYLFGVRFVCSLLGTKKYPI